MSKARVDHAAAFSSILGDLKGIDPEVTQREIPLSNIIFNKKQPRKHIDPESLQTLTASIAGRGVLEPVLVRPLGEDFELIAGERRTRAAREAGLQMIPAIIRTIDDGEALEISIIENLQREDLNPVEETDAILQLLSLRLERPTSDVVEGIRSLYDEGRGRAGNTRISKKEKNKLVEIFSIIGRFTPSSFYSNRIPILSLPSDLLEPVRHGKLEYPKARMLARVKDEVLRGELLERIISEQLSREEVGALIREDREEAKLEPTTTLLRSVKRSLTANRLAGLEQKKQQRVKKLLKELEMLLGK